MATYFKTTARNYSDVTVTADGIDTVQFLQATEGLVKIFGKMRHSSKPCVLHLVLHGLSRHPRPKLVMLTKLHSPLNSFSIHGIDLFGSVFSVVQSDMNGNIKVWDRVDNHARKNDDADMTKSKKSIERTKSRPLLPRERLE